MTNLDFLSGLPAVLGVGGYFAYHLSRSRDKASPILKTIVEIIKGKGVALPELDGRLTAKHVFKLLQDKPELRRSLDGKDYALLESVMKRDERSHVIAMCALLVTLFASFAAYSYLQTLKPKIVSASLVATSKQDTSATIANTIDDLKVDWIHNGENSPFTLRLVNANSPDSRLTKQVMAADHSLRLSSAELRSLWPKPTLDAKSAIRLEFANDDGFKTFGPFEVETALELMYFLEVGKLTVASMDGQGTLIPHSFEARCLAWPMSAKGGRANPVSLIVRTSSGKAYASFPKNFEPDPATLKCVYIGLHPIGLVRYTNLNAR